MTCIDCKYLERATIAVGMTAESAVTLIVYNLFKKGHEWPRLKIISASKAENKETMAQICCL